MPHVDVGAGFLIPALILMAAALALTAFRVDAALARGDGEKLFWIGFTGLLAALLAVAWAVGSDPGAGPWIGLLAVAGAAGAAAWVQVRNRRRMEGRVREESRRRIAALERRHDEVLLSWSSYELDEWKAVEKPGLKDGTKPETKTLMRAMKAASALRPVEGTDAALNEAELGNYAAAVAGLEKAWERAEATAGGGRAV